MLSMIFVLDDANVLAVADAQKTLQGAYEGVGVKDGVYRFFDASGHPLVGEFSVPKRGKVFGRVRWVGTGRYHLLRCDDETIPNLLALLDSVLRIEPNRTFCDVDQVRCALELARENAKPAFELSVQSQTLLRFLAAPRPFQKAYPRRTEAEYGYEGRESYGRAQDGLALLLLVGEDYFHWDRHDIARAREENELLLDSMFQLGALVRFILESGMSTVMDTDDEDECLTYASGMWQVLRQLARRVLAELGIEAKSPTVPYEDVFVQPCHELADPTPPHDR